MADAGSFTNAVALLQQSLGEEQRMAAWVDENNSKLTLQYLERRSAGETASH